MTDTKAKPKIFDIKEYRDIWYKTSFLLDSKQSKNGTALARYNNYKNQPLTYIFPSHFDGKAPVIDYSKPGMILYCTETSFG